jgi:Tfp pilus assembly protein PilO
VNESEIKKGLAALEEREKELRDHYGEIQSRLIELKSLQKEAKRLEAAFDALRDERQTLATAMLRIAAEGTGFEVKD